MKKLKYLDIKFLVLLFFISLSIFSFAKPYYKVNNLKIEAEINKNGTVDISEFVQYKAYDINGILYDIDYKGYGELRNLEVFYEKEREFVPAINDFSRRRGTYIVKDDDELTKVKLYFPMNEEEKWFLFRYTLSQGVTVYNDIAQFNRKMVGQGWKTDIDNIEVKIILPEEISKDKIKAFGHGPLTGNVDIINGREIVYTLNGYYSGEFVETNILFPKELVSDVDSSNIKNENVYDEIIKMENDLADKADLERKFFKMKDTIGNIVFCIMYGWLIFIVIFDYIKNKKSYKVTNEYGDYFRDIPDDFSPAVGGAIVSNRVRPNQLLATVMDLVRRDVLEMIEDRENNKTILRKKDYDEKSLRNYEKFVIAWYIDNLGDGFEISMEEIERIIKDRRSAITFGRNYEKWEAMVKKDLENVGFKKEKKHKLPIILGFITVFLSIPISIFFAVYFDNSKFIPFSFISFMIIILLISGGKYTLEAEKLKVKWLAFKKFLIDYSNLEEAKLASIYIWEHYFVYAIAMGVSEEVAKGYKKIFREDMDTIRYNRTPFMRMYDKNSGFRNIERAMTNSINRGTRALASTRSSSRGSGGGFSGGSSGGGGSRGGGGAF